MSELSLISAAEVQQGLADYLRFKRKALKLSRAELAQRSTVPAATIKKFETTGQISLRQWTLLWQCLDDLKRLDQLTQDSKLTQPPQSIDEVLGQ